MKSNLRKANKDLGSALEVLRAKEEDLSADSGNRPGAARRLAVMQRQIQELEKSQRDIQRAALLMQSHAALSRVEQRQRLQRQQSDPQDPKSLRPINGADVRRVLRDENAKGNPSTLPIPSNPRARTDMQTSLLFMQAKHEQLQAQRQKLEAQARHRRPDGPAGT